MTLCLNGDGRPITPPSKVICRECQDKITKFLHDELERMEAKETHARRTT